MSKLTAPQRVWLLRLSRYPYSLFWSDGPRPIPASVRRLICRRLAEVYSRSANNRQYVKITAAGVAALSRKDENQ